jgi:hypothetical protein
VGTTTHRSVGWAVADAWRDVDNVRRRFRACRETSFTYVWGHSEGGMVTQTVIEKQPHDYDGALPMRARRGRPATSSEPGTSERRTNTSAPACRSRVPLQRVQRWDEPLPGDADCPSGQTCGDLEPAYPPEWGSRRSARSSRSRRRPGNRSRASDFVARHIEACFRGAAPTPEQQARQDLFLRGIADPRELPATDLFFARRARDPQPAHRRWRTVEQRRRDVPLPGSSPPSRPRNAGVPRATNDARRAEYLRRNYEERGHTQSVITPTRSTTGWYSQNEEKYFEVFNTVGRTDQLCSSTRRPAGTAASRSPSTSRR